MGGAIKEQKMVTFGYKKWYAAERIKRYEDVKPYKIIIFNPELCYNI